MVFSWYIYVVCLGCWQVWAVGRLDRGKWRLGYWQVGPL
jgi:hypothetical protein